MPDIQDAEVFIDVVYEGQTQIDLRPELSQVSLISSGLFADIEGPSQRPEVVVLGVQGPAGTPGAQGVPGVQGPPGGKWGPRLITGPGTFQLTASDTLVDIDATLGDVEVILEDTTIMEGLQVILSRIGDASHSITVTGKNGQTINLQPSYVDLVAFGNSITLNANAGTDWRIT